MRFSAFLIVSALSFYTPVSAQQKDRYFDRETVAKLFDGNTVVGRWIEDNTESYNFYSANGRIYSETPSHPEEIGSWFISDDNAICVNIKVVNCMYIGTDGKNIRAWLKTSRGYAPQIILTFANGDVRKLVSRSETANVDRKNYAAKQRQGMQYLLEGMRMGAEDWGRRGGSSSGSDSDRFQNRSYGGSGMNGNGNIGGQSLPSGSGVHGSCGGGGC